ncbi:MAG TPA: ABC transporter substrate-binding protein, partial [bacterium]|nr:ABC transporter substrate-binding protein [bacterium]
MAQVFIRRLLPVLLAVALVPVGLWTAGQAQAQAPKTLVIAIGADQTGLDPQTVENNESGFVMSTIYDSIVNYKPGSSIVGPGLAESWTISPDGKTYTFKLRHGVTFHDGTPMNARTVGQDIDRAINPNNPCYVLGRKGVDTYDDFTFGSVKDGNVAKMDVVDDYTLRFTLPQPNAPFITSVAMIWQGIVSPTATKQYNCDASQHPVGTGPFKFVEAVRNDHITVDANPNYWGGKPKVDRIIFQIVPESATRMLKLERNEAQILADVPPSDYARVTGNSQLKLYTAAGLTILGVAMSNQLGPFKDVRVRQAMNYAVDKDAINKGLYGGATTASQGMPPVLWGFNKAVTPYPYDPAKAKQLLAEAGFANGFTTDMMVYANPRGYNPIGGAKLGEAVQGYLAKVGVTVKITQYEWGAYLDKIRHTEWEGMAISGWSGDNGDPDNFLGALFEWDEVAGKAVGNNNARHHNAAFDKLIVQGRQVSDQAKRAQIYA